MKNKIALYLFLLLSATTVLVLSCNKKKLDLSPYTPTEDNYFASEQDFVKGVNGVYAKLSDFYAYNINNYLSPVRLLMGDDITTDGNFSAYESFTFTPTDGVLTNYYTYSYQLINRANTILEKLNTEKGVYITPHLKDYNKGEVLFLRGMTFFNLWNLFGTSPVITQRILDLDHVNSPSSAGTALLDTAISDLKQAAALLPQSWSATDLGRATSNSANGYLGKALVFRATVAKNQQDYADAIAAFNKIQGVSLVNKFTDNFSYAAENNSESLFEYQAGVSATDNVWLTNDFNGPDKTFSAYWGFYNNHWSLYGAPVYIATNKLKKEFETGDPRLTLTMDTATRYIQKYVGNGLDQVTNSGAGSYNNPRILRYADVLLLKAEAILQSGGAIADAVALINQVRQRARNQQPGAVAPADRDIQQTDRSMALSWLMHERFVEFAGEELIRWFDIRRWYLNGSMGVDLTSFDFSTSSTQKVNFQKQYVLLPIPSGEINSNPNVKQNSGY
ncbi:RagB/SusD family nutrient uptake outer membrane protein [Deminuibacter soli]|uniref:RagB/SusD family nutrient uptake outer membrane protein n=1 Tax=Deminuibacter soli TaxID=2291815 RepID=A0A3E1NEK9_9BACT|nr:RagB/SusD family nutrient uptake outer membrane protein [Deminuibacter soli]RFM26416.1 RagB/SusD family nutrient uptake outer membrane protein [Deminuibacter soli]